MTGFKFGQPQQTDMASGSVPHSVVGGGLVGKPLRPTDPEPLTLDRARSKAEVEKAEYDGFASFSSITNPLQDMIPATEEDATLETQTNKKQVSLPEFPQTPPMQKEVQGKEKKVIRCLKKKSITPESLLVAEAVEKAKSKEEQKPLQCLAAQPPIPKPRRRVCGALRPPRSLTSPPPQYSGRTASAPPFPPPPPPPPPPVCPRGPPPLPPKTSGGGPIPPSPTDQLPLRISSTKLKHAKVSSDLGELELKMRGCGRRRLGKEEARDEMPNSEKEQEERAQRRTREIQLTANILSHEMKMKRIFFKQNREGFWKVIDLPLIGISINRFTDLLENAGARSLGPKIFEEVQRLLATLMMLAFIKLRLGIEFPLPLPPGQAFEVNVGGLGERYSKEIAKALKWIKVQEKKIPLLYSRLEFGANWEAATQTIAQKMNM